MLSSTILVDFVVEVPLSAEHHGRHHGGPAERGHRLADGRATPSPAAAAAACRRVCRIIGACTLPGCLFGRPSPFRRPAVRRQPARMPRRLVGGAEAAGGSMCAALVATAERLKCSDAAVTPARAHICSTHAHTHTLTCIRTHTHTHTHPRTHTHSLTHSLTRAHTLTYTHTHTRIHTLTYTHTHTRTQAHARTRRR